MNEGRTKNTIRNTAYSMAYQLSDILFAFLLRTIFIRTLGKTYLGLSGLFSNILTVLSLMELGVGGAIVFALYKPLADHDYGKVAALMYLYKKVYRVIGAAVCIVGFSLTPFLEYIVNLPAAVEYIYWIYWLSITNTAISYFLAYRRSLLIADQRSDLNIKNQMIFRISRFILLSGALILTQNYIVYLCLDVLNTFLSNLQITYLVKKRYADIEKIQPEPLAAYEKKQILRYMYSGIFTKFGQTVVNCTDSIIISAFVSTILVGFYSNYSMVTNSLDVAVYLIFSGITASIGNFAVEKSARDSELLFKKVTFINYIISFYVTVCLWSLLSPFVSIWAGSDYVLSKSTVAVITLNFYLASMQKSIECFIGSVGEISYHNRYRSLVEGIVNLVASLYMVRFTDLGITGVFLGTTICFVAGRIWMDAYILYKYWFKARFFNYAKQYTLRLILVIGIAFIGKIITSCCFQKFGISLLSWILCGIVLSVLCFSVIVALYHDKDEFLFLKELLIGITKKNREY